MKNIINVFSIALSSFSLSGCYTIGYAGGKVVKTTVHHSTAGFVY